MISLDASAGPVLVVGGGGTGLRKIRTLLKAGMAVTLVSPDAHPDLESMAEERVISWRRRPAERSDFEEHAFALLALSRPATEEVLTLADGTSCLLNCCGAPELGTWSLAAQFRTSRKISEKKPGQTAGPEFFLVGVTSGGQSPGGSAALKRKLQEYLEGERQ
jgi:precorrin-2 dehydrogenase/sirohydrochlorin ferrochelatase